MTGKDWTLLALAAAGNRGLTPVQLQKVLYVFGRELPSSVTGSGYYSFEPYHYGPFNRQIYVDAERLSSAGLAAIDHQPNGTRLYSATACGQTAANQTRQSVNPQIAEYLGSIVRWAQSLSFAQLVKAIYDKYPETSVNSVFRY